MSGRFREPIWPNSEGMTIREETVLARRLKAQIQREGPMTFRDFMDVALYDPNHGFYGKGPSIGDTRWEF